MTLTRRQGHVLSGTQCAIKGGDENRSDAGNQASFHPECNSESAVKERTLQDLNDLREDIKTQKKQRNKQIDALKLLIRVELKTDIKKKLEYVDNLLILVWVLNK